MALAVQRAVKECLNHKFAVFRVHWVLAADGRPVARAAHIEVGGQVDGLVGKIMRRVADVDRVAEAAAARADEQKVVDPRADQLRAVALDAVVGGAGVGAAVDQRGQTGELGRSVEVERGLRRVIPRDIHRAVPDGGGEILRLDSVRARRPREGVGVARGGLLDIGEEIAAVCKRTAHRGEVIARALFDRAGHVACGSCGGNERKQQTKAQKQTDHSCFHRDSSSVTTRPRTRPVGVGISAISA